MNYYNEIDPYAAQWLRNLIAEGLIPDGYVDERDIRDVRSVDLSGFRQCHFFAGIAGWAFALQLAEWPEDREVWTGSCPCQPFSVAGKRKGLSDERHLWPEFKRLIAERRPAVVFGEQVAAASQWLGLVRGDLEAMGYAVGAEPIEAASAGADHLRDRYWFVADAEGERWREGWPEHEVRSGRDAASGDGCSGVAQGDAYEPGSQGRSVLREGADQRAARSSSMADADVVCEGERREQRGRQFGGSGGDPEARRRSNMANREIERRPDRYGGSLQGSTIGERQAQQFERCGGDAGIEWVIGADGKARRVKSGIRLLAHGIPARVGKLRAFGNTIDPRPAAAFIRAYTDIRFHGVSA